jgi:RNA polymerase-binding transcription factor DksA
MDNITLEIFRARLTAEKAMALAKLESLDQQSRETAESQSNEGTFGNDADLASDVVEEEGILSVRADTTTLLEQVEKALERIDNGTYGVSEVSGKPIPIERLQALPWATRLVEEGQEEVSDTTRY